RETLRSGLEHVDGISAHETSGQMILDPASTRNLEIDRSLRERTRAGSLLDAIDRTLTPPGARLLRAWVSAPLLDLPGIAARHDAVEELLTSPAVRAEARTRLDGAHDLERLLARAVAGTAGPRDLLALTVSLERLAALVSTLTRARAALLAEVAAADPC